ncbi:MAG: sensor histidine kinase [Candidatus Coproplasma sp.]
MILNEMNYMSAGLELFSAVVTAVMLIGCFLERKYLGKAGKLFIGVLSANAALMLVDAPIWILLDNPAPEKVLSIKILSFFSNASLSALIALYAFCLTAYIRERKKISYRYAIIISALSGVLLLLWFISSFNGMFIYYDETGLDQTGPLYLLSQIITVLLPAMTMVLAFCNHKALGWRDTLIMALYGVIPIIGVPLQIYWAVTPVCLATTISLVLVYTLIHVDQLKRKESIERELIEKKLALSESNNSLLLSQIQPHFLYNALTSIYRLCDVKPQEAKQAVSDFSKYLRGNLDSIKKSEMISFSNELKHIQAYLALEKIRYDDELEIVYNVPVTEFFVPPLTVQPLVENAVNHGVSDLPNGGRVTISTEEKTDCYEIRVSDNGVGFDPQSVVEDERSHVGINNVRSRLAVMCQGTLEILSSPNEGTTAIIKIPKGDNDR